MSAFPFAIPGVAGSMVAVAGPSSPPAMAAGPSPDLENLSLKVLKERLSTTPHEDKSWLVHVQRVRPELVDDVHLMRFLRVEDYDVELALKRLLKYWELRYKAFGPDKYALPMTLDGAMKDCRDAITATGSFVLLPTFDEAGRAVLYRSSGGYHADALKVWWYLVHVAMENPIATKQGFVILSNARGKRLTDWNPKFTVAMCASDDAFPIRWKMTHVCHAASVFPRVANSIKAAMTPNVRKSFVLHNGSDESVLESLAEYGFNRDCIPTDIGGNLQISVDAFIRQRIAIEGCGSAGRGGGEKMTSSFAGEVRNSSGNSGEDFNKKASAFASHPGSLPEPRAREAARGETRLSGPAMGKSAQVLGGEEEDANTDRQTTFFDLLPIRSASPLRQNHENATYSFGHGGSAHSGGVRQDVGSLQASIVGLRNLQSLSALASNAGQSLVPNASLAAHVPSSVLQPEVYGGTANSSTLPNLTQPQQKSKGSKSSSAKKVPGRGGDPRMLTAIQYRIDNPNMSLIDALIAGGYVFPELGAHTGKIGDVLDSEGISLYQRRNQLLRRLRQAKKKSSEGK